MEVRTLTIRSHGWECAASYLVGMPNAPSGGAIRPDVNWRLEVR